MPDNFVRVIPLPDFHLWDKPEKKRVPSCFDLELTSRCNNNCSHCYINLPAQDTAAKGKELSCQEIENIAEEAASLGAILCLITGGEPLLRKDFFEVYLGLKKKGLLISVFTNATLITERHIKFFKRYPPRDIEITVYGLTEKVYEKVTGTPGSFKAFRRGLSLLFKNGIRVRLKTMLLRSNMEEFSLISQFCRSHGKDYFRYDPFLHLRLDGNPLRNKEIKAERLSPEEIAAFERLDPKRLSALKEECGKINSGQGRCNHIFRCAAGLGSFSISYDGFFRICPSLVHQDCIYNLRKGTLFEAWEKFVLSVRSISSQRKDFLERCARCDFVSLCLWCPAYSYLETGALDTPLEYLCEITRCRLEMLREAEEKGLYDEAQVTSG